MGVVSRRWMYVESMGVASGCGCNEVYRFPHTTYPYSSCICSFLQQHPVLFLNVFHSFIIVGHMHLIIIRCSESHLNVLLL